MVEFIHQQGGCILIQGKQSSTYKESVTKSDSAHHSSGSDSVTVSQFLQ